MGAWSFIEPNLSWVLERIDARQKRPVYVGRPASASTATGLLSKHLFEQKTLVEASLSGELNG
jgi:2-oxoglutarate dehydrogenase E1 component